MQFLRYPRFFKECFLGIDHERGSREWSYDCDIMVI